MFQRFEHRRQSPIVEIRRVRRDRLARALELAGVTIDDIVNVPAAQLRAIAAFRLVSACEWEGLRTRARARAEHEQWVRENR